ncbi:MAG: DMT family transporter [Pirellulaceae bacterium]
MLFSAFSFATMGALAHALRDDVSWQVIALARSFVVLLLSGGILFASGVAFHFRGPWQLWLRSICGSVGMLFIFFSLTRLPVAIVITLINLAPAWVAIASWFLMPDTRAKSTWGAVAVGFVGVFLIQQPELAQGNRAVLAPLIASLLLAVVMLALHHAKNVDSRAVVLHFAMTACVTSLCVFLFSAWSMSLHLSFQPGVVLMLLATGVAATLGQLLLTIAFASGPPEKVSVVSLTQVGFAMFYDLFVWGHEFNVLSLIGIALVVAPTGWLLYVERRRLAET